MCGRFYVDESIVAAIERVVSTFHGTANIGDVTPGMTPLILRGENGMVKAEYMHWGLQKLGGAGTIINARADSVLQKPMFGESVMSRRIVIPATKFYEWDSDKNKAIFSNPNAATIYLAGFYQISNNQNAFVILTTDANDSMLPVHDRMPVMIAEGEITDWLFDSSQTSKFLKRKMPELKREQEYEQMKLFS